MLTAFVIFLGLVTAFWAWLASSPAHRQTFSLLLSSRDTAGEAIDLPPVAMVVPARNEGPVLPTTVPTLCGQDYPSLRVIVVDDQSEDDSAAILARFAAQYPSLTVVHATARPEGWCGKPWAVSEGMAAAGGADWLLFTDADCEFHPLAVRNAMAFATKHDLDLLSLVPQMTFGSAIERVGIPGLVTALALMFPVGWSNDPKRPLALAAGAFLLARRGAYEKVGGHAAVKSEIIEDLNLAKKMKASGAKVHTRLTPDLVKTRMYEGFADLWEGLGKNAYAGMEYQPHKFWTGLVAGLLVAVLPPVYLALSLAWVIGSSDSRRAWAALILSLLLNLLIVLVHRRAVRFLRLPIYHALLMPVSAALYMMIAISSAWQHHYRGGNLWKGRRYTREMLLSGSAAAAKETQVAP